MTLAESRKPYRRLSRYPVPLTAMISEDAAAEIGRLAELADWPSAEVVRRALDVGLPSVEKQLSGGQEEQ